MKKVVISLVFLMVMFILVGLSFASEIKSMKVIKIGKPTVVHIGMMPELGTIVSRPVVIRVTYRCSPKEKWSTIDIETTQVNDKWGEWVTDKRHAEYQIMKNCGEETSWERDAREERKREEEAAKLERESEREKQARDERQAEWFDRMRRGEQMIRNSK